MKCAWCGVELTYVRHDLAVDSVFRCKTRNCPASWSWELAVPQIGSAAYDEVMKKQASPDWKPILLGGH